MQKITSFLWFDTQAEEAAKFYVSVFKKKSKILSVARYGDGGPGPKGSVMVVEFMLEGQRFMALNGGPQFKFNESVSFVISCEISQDVDHYWSKLTEGGKPGRCGWLKDKYRLSRLVVPVGLGDKTPRGRWRRCLAFAHDRKKVPALHTQRAPDHSASASKKRNFR